MAFTVHYHQLKNGRQLVQGVLDDPPALNALSPAMARDMLAALDEWRNDNDIAAIILRGGGDRHFCAGGNIREIATMMREQRWDQVSAFFFDEYRLDMTLYDYPKPIIGWGNGALMGGGMGVFQGCTLRLVTPTLKMAMPEVHIGLFPDVGAAWFLRRVPPPLGLFLGLSGVTINAHDARYARLADFVMPDEGYDAFVARLVGAELGGDATDDLQEVQYIAADMALASAEEEPMLAQAQAEITACCQYGRVASIAAVLTQAAHPWLRQVSERLAAASPGAVVYWYRHWQALQEATMAEVFAADYRGMLAFARDGEFAEGVRALVIDKDRKPRWRHGGYDEVPENWPRVHDEDVAVAAGLLL